MPRSKTRRVPSQGTLRQHGTCARCAIREHKDAPHARQSEPNDLVVAGLGLAVSPIAAAASSDSATPAEAVSKPGLRPMLARLVAFGTRHTLSSQSDPKARDRGRRGPGPRRSLRKTSAACGGASRSCCPRPWCRASGCRARRGLSMSWRSSAGFSRPNEVVIVQGHIEQPQFAICSIARAMRRGRTMTVRHRAGAGGGAGAFAEKFAGTIVYAVLLGRGAGALWRHRLAEYAKKQGWTVKAVLNNAASSAIRAGPTGWSMTAMCGCFRRAARRCERAGARCAAQRGRRERQPFAQPLALDCRAWRST